ncbi:tyrosine-type recombinase/integrase [Pseudoduganella sp. UC29_106]|uniref:tyrosine-type recombinase/integrase n=1 Tax=Pseudoduganella sp. UC29_106 TaxID=3374553 RepID=UPI003757650B
MHLFFTDDTFKQQGVSRAGVPFLCDAQMRLVDAPNRYLRYIAIISGKTSSPRTWETYGNHLYEFFSFLESNQLRWDLIGIAEMAAWRDTMRKRECSRSTVNQRLRCAQAFFQWASDSDLIEKSPIATVSVRVTKRGGLLSHIDTSANRTTANVLTLPQYEAPPQFIHIRDAFAFISALTSHTLKHMAYLALLSGMRRDEIISLSFKVLPNPCGLDSRKLVPMRLDANLTPTKGSKTRTVMVPYDLAAALWNYFCMEWPLRQRMFEQRHRRETTRLFFVH